MKRSLFVITFLCFASLVFAKSYSISLFKNTTVGTSKLAEGIYYVKLDGDKAIFTDSGRKDVTVAGKVSEATGKKFATTSVETSEKNGNTVIKAIHFGGSNTIIEFAD